jgi:hypothetical protein
MLFNNCYILYCFRLVAKVANVIGHHKAAAGYDATATSLATAIHKRFYIPTTSGYLDNLQPHLVMPLVAGVPPSPAIHAKVMEALRVESANQQYHIDTGLHATYFMTKLLYDTSQGFGGEDALLAQLALQPTAPGYNDLLEKGYTTWPEGEGAWWSSLLPSLNPNPNPDPNPNPNPNPNLNPNPKPNPNPNSMGNVRQGGMGKHH